MRRKQQNNTVQKHFKIEAANKRTITPKNTQMIRPSGRTKKYNWHIFQSFFAKMLPGKSKHCNRNKQGRFNIKSGTGPGLPVKSFGFDIYSQK